MQRASQASVTMATVSSLGKITLGGGEMVHILDGADKLHWWEKPGRKLEMLVSGGSV